MGDPDPEWAKRFRKVHVHRDQLGLTTEDLGEIVEYLLRRDVPSLKSLTIEQLDRLLDGFELAGFVLHLRDG